eukprot:COSAG01_NODE_12228_length_1777_cov_1.592968_1_plen_78_part_00
MDRFFASDCGKPSGVALCYNSVLVCDGVVSRLHPTDSTELCYSSLSFVQGSTRVLWDEMAAGTISHTFTTTRQVLSG